MQVVVAVVAAMVVGAPRVPTLPIAAMAPPEVDPAIENALEKKEAHEPAASGLKARTFKYGNYEGHIIAPKDYRGDAAFLPLVFLVPFAGGFYKTKKKHGKQEMGKLEFPLNCPMGPCWYAYMDVPGNHRVGVPQEFIQFIKDLHAMCSHKQNLIIAKQPFGSCRGLAGVLGLLKRSSGKHTDKMECRCPNSN